MAAAQALAIRARGSCRWDLASLGEVMLRLDPGDNRVATARTFQVWEGGGEYNVARNLARCFGLDTTIVTALVDNPPGRLVEDLIRQGGVDRSHIRWTAFDGVGRAARVGLNFTERGFGIRGGVGTYDRGHTAVSQLKPGDVDWNRIFGAEGARWFHTGGIFCGLSETAPQVAKAAMEAARKHGAIVSYDLNYRASLWQASGGQARADAVNRELLPLVDVLFGEDLGAAPAGGGPKVVASTMRVVHDASRHDFGAECRVGEARHRAELRRDVAVLDRVGSGDAFAAGVIYGLLAERGAQYAVECGAALGALAMTTPGDAALATLAEIEAAMQGARPGIAR